MSTKRKAKYNLRSATNKKKFRGLTLPGYNNLGPFNELGVPLTKSDLAALTHDKEYGELGKRAYWSFNDADEKFLNEIEEEVDVGANIAKKVFKGKKKLAEWKLIPTIPGQSKIRDDNPFLTTFASRDGPITRAQAKINARKEQISQRKITDTFKKKKLIPNPQPLLNLQEKTQAPTIVPNMTRTVPGGDGSSNTQGLTETKIDTVVDVERGFPSYQFASLPWSGTFFKDSNLYTGIDMGFRMTSPYDVVIGGTTVDRNTNATGKATDVEMKTDAQDTTIQSAMWFNWYASLYKYYHVVACKWSILFENLSNEPLWIHKFYLNDTTPPYYASNDDMLNWPDCESHYLEPQAKYVDANGVKSAQLAEGWQRETQNALGSTNFDGATAINSNRRNILQLSGQYSPGDINHDIRLDSEVENWTLVNANPKLIERLAFRLKPESQGQRTGNTDQGAVNYGRKFKYKYTIRLEYLVEFKELVEALRWPTTYTTILPTIVADAFTTEKQNENEPNP